MNYSELNKIISGKFKIKELVEIFRNEIDEISMLGRPVSVSSALLSFELFSDFIFDGIKIIRNRDISDVVTCEKNNSLNFINKICKKEHLFSDEPNRIDLKNWNSVFSFISGNDLAVSVECAFEDAIDYYFGKILQINSNIVTMKCFDGGGNIFKDDVKINLNYVSAVSIGDRYTTFMSKHIYN